MYLICFVVAFFKFGVPRKNGIKNKYIRGTVKVTEVGKKMQEERLHSYGHVMRKDEDYKGEE